MLDHPRERPEWVKREELPFASRWAQTGRGTVHYVDEGPEQAPVVLLVHGTPTWCFEFRGLIRELSRTRRVIAFDHLGFGLSERPRDFPYTPEAHTEVLRELLLVLGLSRFSLVVHDYGGPIALPLAVEAPARIERLVVLNSWMWPLGEDTSLAKTARFVATRWGRAMYRWLNFSLRVLLPYAYANRRKLTASVHAHYLEPFRDREARVRVLWTLAKALSSSNATLARLWERRASLTAIPALVVWGLGDRILPPRLLSRLREALPHAVVHALPEVGHWPQEEAPEAVASLLDGFLPRAE